MLCCMSLQQVSLLPIFCLLLILGGIADSSSALSLVDDLFGSIRVCTDDGDKYETTAMECPSGVFLKEPFAPGCVCFQGTWVLHSSLCDHSPYIFYGEVAADPHCYYINFHISTFIYLGDPFDITNSRTYVAPHSLTVFYEIPKNNTMSPMIDFHWPSIVALNPDPMIRIEAAEKGKLSSVCFSKTELIPESIIVKGHIWDGARGPTSYRTVGSCDGMTLGGYDSLIGTSNNFFYRSNKAVPVPYLHSQCFSKCDKGALTNSVSSAGGSESDTFQTNGIISENNTDGESGVRGKRAMPRSFDKRNLYSNETYTLRRKKRYKTRETVESTWNGKGFCMKSYWDPNLKFEMTNVFEKRCYPEKNDWLIIPSPPAATG